MAFTLLRLKTYVIAVPYIAHAVCRLLLIAPRPVYVGFVVGKVTQVQVTLTILPLSPVNIIPQLLRIPSCTTIMRGMDNGHVSGRNSTRTKSHPTVEIDTGST
jgi:hypothetical protein